MVSSKIKKSAPQLNPRVFSECVRNLVLCFNGEGGKTFRKKKNPACNRKTRVLYVSSVFPAGIHNPWTELALTFHKQQGNCSQGFYEYHYLFAKKAMDKRGKWIWICSESEHPVLDCSPTGREPDSVPRQRAKETSLPCCTTKFCSWRAKLGTEEGFCIIFRADKDLKTLEH